MSQDRGATTQSPKHCQRKVILRCARLQAQRCGTDNTPREAGDGARELQQVLESAAKRNLRDMNSFENLLEAGTKVDIPEHPSGAYNEVSAWGAEEDGGKSVGKRKNSSRLVFNETFSSNMLLNLSNNLDNYSQVVRSQRAQTTQHGVRRKLQLYNGNNNSSFRAPLETTEATDRDQSSSDEASRSDANQQQQRVIEEASSTISRSDTQIFCPSLSNMNNFHNNTLQSELSLETEQSRQERQRLVHKLQIQQLRQEAEGYVSPRCPVHLELSVSVKDGAKNTLRESSELATNTDYPPHGEDYYQEDGGMKKNFKIRSVQTAGEGSQIRKLIMREIQATQQHKENLGVRVKPRLRANNSSEKSVIKFVTATGGFAMNKQYLINTAETPISTNSLSATATNSGTQGVRSNSKGSIRMQARREAAFQTNNELKSLFHAMVSRRTEERGGEYAQQAKMSEHSIKINNFGSTTTKNMCNKNSSIDASAMGNSDVANSTMGRRVPMALKKSIFVPNSNCNFLPPNIHDLRYQQQILSRTQLKKQARQTAAPGISLVSGNTTCKDSDLSKLICFSESYAQRQLLLHDKGEQLPNCCANENQPPVGEAQCTAAFKTTSEDLHKSIVLTLLHTRCNRLAQGGADGAAATAQQTAAFQQFKKPSEPHSVKLLKRAKSTGRHNQRIQQNSAYTAQQMRQRNVSAQGAQKARNLTPHTRPYYEQYSNILRGTKQRQDSHHTLLI